MDQKRKPSIYIPSLYFAEGLPYTIVMMMSGVFFKSLGADNVFIGLTSLLYWPWVLKFAWAPMVDYYGTKRTWIIVSQLVLGALTVALGAVAYFSGTMTFDHMIGLAVAALTLIAFASATQDVSIDGYYLDVLNEEQKAFYVGVRNTAYKIAWLFGSGAMVYLAGKLAEGNSLGYGWSIAFALCGVCMLAAGLFHIWYLPPVDKPVYASEVRSDKIAAAKTGPDFFKSIGSYFKQPGIVAIVVYILLFRLGDALMLKQAPNFLLDPTAKGGLGISVADMGIISGTVGVIALLLGGIVGSWLISKGGLKKWMWPLALIQNAAILLYWLLAAWPNTFAVASFSNPHLPAVYVINSAEQFAYGMGVAAYTVFLLSTVRTEHKAAHYATATALMALGMMLPGAISGYLYQALGYANFFLVSFFASLPGIFAIFFLPLWRREDPAKPAGPTQGEDSALPQTGQVGSESK